MTAIRSFLIRMGHSKALRMARKRQELTRFPKVEQCGSGMGTSRKNVPTRSTRTDSISPSTGSSFITLITQSSSGEIGSDPAACFRGGKFQRLTKQNAKARVKENQKAVAGDLKG